MISRSRIAGAMQRPMNGNEATRNPVTTVIEAQGYTLAELRWRLHQVRGKRVPERTLRNWLTELRIKPDSTGFYSEEDLLILRRLVLFLRRRPSIAAFKTLLSEELNNAY